jgi:hypothetical protein
MTLTARDRRRVLRILGPGHVAVLVPLVALERRMRRTGGPGIIPFARAKCALLVVGWLYLALGLAAAVTSRR